jgi:bacterioferritin-associated ferredoxin
MHPMIVCVCKAVSERQIRAAVNDGATCVRDLARNLGLGTCCGKCLPEAQATISKTLAAGASTAPGMFVAA